MLTMQRDFTDSAGSVPRKGCLVCAAAHRDVEDERAVPHRLQAPDSLRLLRFRSGGAVMVKNATDAARRQVEVLARIVLVVMVVLLTVGAVKLYWSWPAEPILQFLRFQ
jgi:hypothetical protein